VGRFFERAWNADTGGELENWWGGERGRERGMGLGAIKSHGLCRDQSQLNGASASSECFSAFLLAKRMPKG